MIPGDKPVEGPREWDYLFRGDEGAFTRNIAGGYIPRRGTR